MKGPRFTGAGMVKRNGDFRTTLYCENKNPSAATTLSTRPSIMPSSDMHNMQEAATGLLFVA